MEDSTNNKNKIISDIYETAEDIALWPKLIEVCKSELDAISLENSEGVSESERELGVHLDRALRINSRLDQMQQEVGAARKVLDHLPIAVVTLCAQLKIVRLNKLAHKMFLDSKILAIDNGKLVSDSDLNNKKLAQFVNSTLHSKENTKQSLKIQSAESDEQISLYSVKTDGLGENPNLCTLFISTSNVVSYLNPITLKKLFNLTTAEARLTHMLVSGDSLIDVAKKLGVSHNTVRNQLKSVFSKTNTSRQSELVVLILSTPTDTLDSSDTAKNSSLAIKNTESQNTKSIRLKDGRSLAYLEFGDKNGTPILYLHDIIAWDWWNLFGEDEFAALHLKMIVPFRPGFLDSDINKVMSFNSWADDVRQLLDVLKIEKFYALGFSSGAAYAAGTAYYLSDRCLGVAMVSGNAAVEGIADLDDVRPAMSKLVLGFARYTPRLYQGFFKALLKTAQVDAHNYLKEYMGHWSEYDSNLCADPFVLMSLSDRFRETLSANPEGMINEVSALMRAWDFQLQDLSVTLHIWRGADDRAVSQNLVRRLVTTPGAKVNEVPGCGHLLIFDHWREILKKLVDPNNANA